MKINKRSVLMATGLTLALAASSCLADTTATYTCQATTQLSAVGGTIRSQQQPTGTLYVLKNGLSNAIIVSDSKGGLMPMPQVSTELFMFVPTGGKAPTLADFNNEIKQLSAPVISTDAEPVNISCVYDNPNDGGHQTGLNVIATFDPSNFNIWGNGGCEQNGSNSITCTNYDSK